jgi:predicted nucleotidyltransferase
MSDLPERLIEELPDHLILCAYYGSTADNTDVYESDVDVLGVYMAPVEYYVGLGRGKYYKGHHKTVDNYDITTYELRKFAHLLIKADPSALGLLWAMKDNYIDPIKPYGRTLIDRREMFLSKRIYNSFVGYAHSLFEQVKNVKDLRGKKRKQLIKKYGYDCKSAAKCVKILKDAMEFLETGKHNNLRSLIDSQYLVSMRTGEVGFGQVIKEIDKLFNFVEKAYKKSKLPEEPDIDRIEYFIMGIILDYIHVEYIWQGT